MIETVSENELSEIVKNLGVLKSRFGRYAARDVAKVFFGLQPGDYCTYRSEDRENISDALGAFDRLSEINPEFVFDDINTLRKVPGFETPDREIVYWNPSLISGVEDRTGFFNLVERYKEVQSVDVDREERSRINAAFFGFPECCTDTWILINGDEFVPVTDEAEKRAREYFSSEVTNPFLRYREQPRVKYLEHVPCSSHCKETIEMVERYKPVVDLVYSIISPKEGGSPSRSQSSSSSSLCTTSC